MSWSVSFIGKPEKIVEALEKHSESTSGQSKVEYDEAKPHLIALVKQNFETRQSPYTQPMIKLEASGSGSSRGEDQIQRSLSVKLEVFYGNLLI